MSGYRTLSTDVVLSSARFTDVKPLVHEPRRMRVMIVDDDAVSRMLYDAVVSSHAQCDVVHTAVNVADGMLAVAQHNPDIVVSDFHMPDATGLDLLRYIKRMHPGVEVVILSGDANLSERQAVIDSGAHTVLKKPVGIAEFHAVLDSMRANLESIQV